MTPSPQAPLAERMRPKSLEDYVGQEHLIGPGGALTEWLNAGHMPSFIFWGPPGVGKTTLANLIAQKLGRRFFSLSAVHSGVRELRETLLAAERRDLFAEGVPLLFIDEIHRFSKAQQDALLGAVESGVVRLIGATTENPGFEIIPALLSRCQVFVLRPLGRDELCRIGKQAFERDPGSMPLRMPDDQWDPLIRMADGDARRLLNLIEWAAATADEGGILNIDPERIARMREANPILFERGGEQHYDLISALIKSVRGSDPDAAVYYLARLIAAGEDPLFIARRLVILSAEDIGLSDPNALMLATACFEAVERIGLPEARIPLAECTIYLSLASKSNSAYLAIDAALAEVERSGRLEVPLELRNAANPLLRQLGYGAQYIYPHDQTHRLAAVDYLPESIREKRFYQAAENEREQRMAQRLKNLRDSK